MQKLTVLLFIFGSFFITSSFAQSGMRLANMKQRLMTELEIDNIKADSVVSIVQDFYANARAIKSNAELKEEDRKPALQNNRKAELVRLRAQLSKEQIRKLQQVMEEAKEERQHRKSAKDSATAN